MIPKLAITWKARLVTMGSSFLDFMFYFLAQRKNPYSAKEAKERPLVCLVQDWLTRQACSCSVSWREWRKVRASTAIAVNKRWVLCLWRMHEISGLLSVIRFKGALLSAKLWALCHHLEELDPVLSYRLHIHHLCQCWDFSTIVVGADQLQVVWAACWLGCTLQSVWFSGLLAAESIHISFAWYLKHVYFQHEYVGGAPCLFRWLISRKMPFFSQIQKHLFGCWWSFPSPSCSITDGSAKVEEIRNCTKTRWKYGLL
jgi:hypothetical protein